MTKYYIYTDVVRGPFSLENIALMFLDGRIDLNTPVTTGRGMPWQKVSEIREITEAAQVSKKKENAPIAQQDFFIFFCPECGQKYSGHTSWRGREFICQSCNKLFTAGGTADASAQQTTLQDNANLQTDWSSGNGNVICPHCWYHFNSEDILYIATHPSLMGDPILGPGAMKRFAPVKFNALGQALDEMNQVTTDTACPRCRLKIPLTILDEETYYFSLVGAPSSGKSYYLATLLHTLRGRMSADMGCTLLDVDPELNQVLNSYETALFYTPQRNNVAILPKTQQTGADFVNVVELDNVPVHLPKPFIYELNYQSGNSKSNDCNLIFYDNAGEQFQPGADNITNPGTRHLACSNGIIFIFDPLNDAQMRMKCNPDEPQLRTDNFVYDQNGLLSEMISRIRRHRNMETSEKCDIPLVIAIGKYDAWQEAFPIKLPQQLLERSSNKLYGSWNRNMMLEVSLSAREMLMNYAPAIVFSAEAFFEKVSFVPFSSFGCLSCSSASGQLGVIPEKANPIWAAEPFMALLAENDLIAVTPDPIDAAVVNGKCYDNGVFFTHPKSQREMRLPINYAGAVIKIDDTYYKLPARTPDSSIWES